MVLNFLIILLVVRTPLLSAQGFDDIQSLSRCGVRAPRIVSSAQINDTNIKKQGCLDSQLQRAASVGCDSNNLVCLCNNAAFNGAVAACSDLSCKGTNSSDDTISVIMDYCVCDFVYLHN